MKIKGETVIYISKEEKSRKIESKIEKEKRKKDIERKSDKEEKKRKIERKSDREEKEKLKRAAEKKTKGKFERKLSTRKERKIKFYHMKLKKESICNWHKDKHNSNKYFFLKYECIENNDI